MADKATAGPAEAVILCGGLGTRIRSVAADRPKALIQVLGQPFLEWLIRGLARDHVRRVVLAVGYMGENIRSVIGIERCGVEIAYSVEKELLGTGGALRLALDKTSSATLLVMNGDSICRYDSGRLVDTHVKNHAKATLWLAPASDEERFGNVAVDEDGRVTAFSEKSSRQGGGWVNAGVYVMARDAIAAIQPQKFVSLEREVFPSLVGRGLYGVTGDGMFVDIGTPESLDEAQIRLAPYLESLKCAATTEG